MRGLPWIRLDTDVKEHPKSDRLADALDERRAWTYMVELWLWVANNQPDGDMSNVPDSGIARRAGYEGDPKRFVKALISSGFLSEGRILSGWQERQAAIVAKFVRDRAKPDGRKGAKSGQSPEIPRGIQEGEQRDSGGIDAAPAVIPHGDVDVDVDEKDQELSSGKPDAASPPKDTTTDTTPRPSSTGSNGTSQVADGGGLFGDAPDPKATIEARVTAVLTDWRTRMGMPKAAIEDKAADKRRSRIRARLDEGWTVERLAAVVTGALKDPWLMGTDPKARPGGYRDVETVFRDNAQCERLEALASSATPKPPPPSSPDPFASLPRPQPFVPRPEFTPEERERAAQARREARPNWSAA